MGGFIATSFSEFSQFTFEKRHKKDLQQIYEVLDVNQATPISIEQNISEHSRILHMHYFKGIKSAKSAKLNLFENPRQSNPQNFFPIFANRT